MPKVSVVAMDAVPDPPADERRQSKYRLLWEQVQELKAGKALRVVFEAEKQAKYVRGLMRNKAKAHKLFLSSSHDADCVTWYFWLETGV